MAEQVTVEQLQRRQEELAAKASELRAKVRDLQKRIAEPDLDPTLDFEKAVAALADDDTALRAAQAMLAAIEQQRAAVTAAIHERHAQTREARLDALRPQEDAAKKRLAECFMAYAKALEEARDVARKIKRAGGGSGLVEIVRRDTVTGIYKQAELIVKFAAEQAAAAGVTENILR